MRKEDTIYTAQLYTVPDILYITDQCFSMLSWTLGMESRREPDNLSLHTS